MCVSHTSGTSLCPLFISGKLGTSEPIEETKFDFEEAIFNYILKWESASCLASFVSLDAFSKLQRNDSALLCYTIIISVQKLTQVIKATTKGFLRIHKHNRKMLKKMLAKDNWNKLGKRSHLLRVLIKKYFQINSEVCEMSLLLIPIFLKLRWKKKAVTCVNLNDLFHLKKIRR